MNDELERLRAELDTVDGELIAAIGRRQALIAAIGEHKQASGRATRDFVREKEVIDAARQRAAAADVDPDLAEEIMTGLIRASLTVQEAARVAASGRGSGRRVLVIGGAGKMGRWFVRFFQSQQYHVTVADPAPCELADAAYPSWQDAGLDVDVIVVATELALSRRILEELVAAAPAALLFDIGSLKTPLRDPLAAAARAGLNVTSLHPMFGPDTRLLSGRHMVFVDVGNASATAAARDLFAATMVEQVDMDLDEHDRLIAYVLGLSHALNIAFFTALAESGEAVPRLKQLSSTTFDAQLGVARDVARESPSLYFEIQHLNEFGLYPLAALSDAAERLLQCVRSGDAEAFSALMQNGSRYFEL